MPSEMWVTRERCLLGTWQVTAFLIMMKSIMEELVYL